MRTRSEATMSTTVPNEPPKLLVLPQTLSRDASIVTLAHPRTQIPTRYYFCPETGVYEFTKIAAPKSDYRSWLLGPTSPGEGSNPGGEKEAEVNNGSEVSDKETTETISKGYAIKTAELYTVTRIDVLFLLLPVLSPRPSSTRAETQKILFLSVDDLFENLVAISKHFSVLSRHAPTKARLIKRLGDVCDTVEAGDEKMYRLNHEKLLLDLVVKARRMVASGFPASMDEKFVKKALEVPIMGIKREETGVSERSIESQDVVDPGPREPSETQSSTATLSKTDSQSTLETNLTTADTQSSLDTTSTPLTPGDQPSEHSHLLRLRTSLTYILSVYVPSHLTAPLTHLLSSPTSPLNLEPLTTHLSHLASLRTTALASRSLGDYSRKRGYEDEEAAESRAEKKLKKEEEEKRKKAGQSKAVRDLKKVDVKGMKKMSDFFGVGVKKGG